MIVFLLIGRMPTILALCLLGLIYLSWVELRAEELPFLHMAWWLLLVFLLNVVGYLALRAWVASRRRRRRTARA